jgi:hypothetical protein
VRFISRSRIISHCSFNGIFRAPEQRRFLLVSARRAEELVRSIERRFPIVVCDFSYGPTRYHHIAYEVAEQLGVALPAFNHFVSSDDSTQNIENELRGNLNKLSALALANTLAKVLLASAHRLVILMPTKRYKWTEANTAFVEFMADALRERTPRIVLVHRSSNLQGSVPKHWRFTRAKLPRQRSCVDARPASPSRHSSVRKENARALNLVGIVAARLASTSDHVRRSATRTAEHPVCATRSTARRKTIIQQLTQSANEAAAQGDLCFAVMQAEDAYRLARNGIERAGALYDLQIQRIRAARFSEAAGEILPFNIRDRHLLRQLLWSTGYAAAMDGDPQIAKWYLLAAAPGVIPCKWADLFARNTLALALAKCGAVDNAFKLLHGIMEHEDTNSQLRSICLLNIARLHRTQGSTAATADAFRSWERFIDGSCIENEFLLKCIYLARSGLNKTAFDVLCEWMRATIHWLANPAPECLGWRTASALNSGKVVATNVDNICMTLTRELTGSASQAGVRIGKLPIASTYVYLSDMRGSHSQSLVAIDGPRIGLLASNIRQSPVYDSTAHRRLRRTLGNLLLALIGPSALAETYYLDASEGYDMPTNSKETLDSAARHGACAIISRNGIRLFDKPKRVQRQLNSYVGLSAAVDRIVHNREGVMVQFKRHWPPCVLSPAQGRLVGQIGDGAKLRKLGPSGRDLLKTLRELELLRIIRLRGA